MTSHEKSTTSNEAQGDMRLSELCARVGVQAVLKDADVSLETLRLMQAAAEKAASTTAACLELAVSMKANALNSDFRSIGQETIGAAAALAGGISMAQLGEMDIIEQLRRVANG